MVLFISHLTYLVQLPYLGKSQSTKMTNFAVSITNYAKNYCNRTLIVEVIVEM